MQLSLSPRRPASVPISSSEPITSGIRLTNSEGTKTHESHMIEGLGTDCKTSFYSLACDLRTPKYFPRPKAALQL